MTNSPETNTAKIEAMLPVARLISVTSISKGMLAGTMRAHDLHDLALCIKFADSGSATPSTKGIAFNIARVVASVEMVDIIDNSKIENRVSNEVLNLAVQTSRALRGF